MDDIDKIKIIKESFTVCISEIEIKAVSGYFSDLDIVIAAYIFGSKATGKSGPMSDLDIAVLLKENVDPSNYFDLRMKLMADLMRTLGINDIDLVILNQAPLILIHEVLKKGRIIFCRDERTRVSFVFKAIRDYLDTNYIRQIQSRGLHCRIKEGSFGNIKTSRGYTLEKIRDLSKKIARAGNLRI